jgi:hypothetical protein
MIAAAVRNPVERTVTVRRVRIDWGQIRRNSPRIGLIYEVAVLARVLQKGEHRKVYFDNTEGQLKERIGTNKGQVQ